MATTKIDIPDVNRQFLLKQLDSGISPTVISKVYQRKYGEALKPQDIEVLRATLYSPATLKQKQSVEEIRSKLPSHDRQLEFARALIEDRLNADPTNTELVALAREYRSNIMASQQIASMSADNGQTQFVLIYGDTVQAASQGANIEDAEFSILEDDE